MHHTIAGLCLILLSFGACSSTLSLSKNMIFYDKNENVRDIVEVISHENKNVYFKVDAHEVMSPDLGTESKLKSYDTPDELGLFVTPNMGLISPQKGSETLSIININKDLNKERVYRVTVKPVIPEWGIKGEQKAQIKLLLGYDILIHVQPEDPQLAYDYSWHNNEFHFKNTGNTHVELKNGKVCDASEVCTSLPKGRAYSEQTISLTLPDGSRYVVFDLIIKGLKRENVKFNL